MIMLNSKIHGHLVKSHCTLLKTVKICHVRNLASCEFFHEAIKMIKNNETKTNTMSKLRGG